jgi:hypothetical protein
LLKLNLYLEKYAIEAKVVAYGARSRQNWPYYLAAAKSMKVIEMD